MPRITSTELQVRAMQNAAEDRRHEWPVEAGEKSDAALAIFVKLQQQRAYDDWTPSDLIALASLADLYAECVEQTAVLKSEGRVVHGKNMVMMENPRCKIVTQLHTTIHSKTRVLGLTHTSQVDQRSRANRGQQERDARRAGEEVRVASTLI